ncbi:hypothetical protein PR048_010205 [Dryococelus australis]|uniref:Uncharacterized protein n=1 Tax=Dryococelus australis TaxID=614101 RepID=A0ABQ9I238_9NEOP|nr:hypothetical protein PR048_010205 [Dryococelus australis]
MLMIVMLKFKKKAAVKLTAKNVKKLSTMMLKELSEKRIKIMDAAHEAVKVSPKLKMPGERLDSLQRDLPLSLGPRSLGGSAVGRSVGQPVATRLLWRMAASHCHVTGPVHFVTEARTIEESSNTIHSFTRKTVPVSNIRMRHIEILPEWLQAAQIPVWLAQSTAWLAPPAATTSSATTTPRRSSRKRLCCDCDHAAYPCHDPCKPSCPNNIGVKIHGYFLE